MKLNHNFLLQPMGEMTVLVPVQEEGRRFHGIIELNSTAGFIVKCLQKDTTKDAIVDALRSKYDASDDTYFHAVEKVLMHLRSCGALVE